MTRATLNLIGIIVVVGAIVYLITVFGDFMDRGSAILGEKEHQREMTIVEEKIKWCHDRDGTAVVILDKYKVNCEIPPKDIENKP